MKFSRVLVTLFVCLSLFTSLIIPVNAQGCGDLNDDGIYSTADVIIALKYASGLIDYTDDQYKNADVVRDGVVDSRDARELLRIAACISTPPEHEYSDWEVIIEPTCTEDGEMVCYCTICDEAFYGTIPCTGHSFVDDQCENCGFILNTNTITYNKKRVAFNSSTTKVKEILGVPTEILSDKTTNDKNVRIYVYCNDYKNLGIFTFIGNKLVQFYSNNINTAVSHNDDVYSLKNPGPYEYYDEIENITIIQYFDTHAEDGEYVYSYSASTDGTYSFSNYTNRAANEKLVFHLTNGCRAINGVKPLEYCDKVAEVSYNHSLDMAKNNYFDHYNQEGQSPWERAEEAGITDFYAYAENIAAGYTDAYEVNNGWYNSYGHRVNMLSGDLTHLGVGIAQYRASDYLYYSTQNFYSPY